MQRAWSPRFVDAWNTKQNGNISNCLISEAHRKAFVVNGVNIYLSPKSITNKQNHSNPFVAYERTFGAWLIKNFGENAIQKYWSNKNTVSPFSINAQSNKKVYIQCQNKNYHVYQISPANFCRGNRCPFCSGKRGRVMPQDSLGAKFPQVIAMWSTKNKLSPFEITFKSHKSVWLTCPEHKHPDFQKIVAQCTTTGRFHCPKCTQERRRSYLEEEVYNYLCKFGYPVLTEHQCTLRPINPETGMPLPYDNQISDLKLIVEVNGIQHYELGGWHITAAKKSGKTPQEEFEGLWYRDKLKKQFALDNGYHYIAISYKDVENGNYKSILDEEINALQNNTETVETTGA